MFLVGQLADLQIFPRPSSPPAKGTKKGLEIRDATGPAHTDLIEGAP